MAEIVPVMKSWLKSCMFASLDGPPYLPMLTGSYLDVISRGTQAGNEFVVYDGRHMMQAFLSFDAARDIREETRITTEYLPGHVIMASLVRVVPRLSVSPPAAGLLIVRARVLRGLRPRQVRRKLRPVHEDSDVRDALLEISCSRHAQLGTPVTLKMPNSVSRQPCRSSYTDSLFETYCEKVRGSTPKVALNDGDDAHSADQGLTGNHGNPITGITANASSFEEFLQESQRLTLELNKHNDAYYAAQERNLQQQPDVKSVGGECSMDSGSQQQSATSDDDSSFEEFLQKSRRRTFVFNDDNDAHYADQGRAGNNENPMTVAERNLQQQPDMKAVGGGDSMDCVSEQPWIYYDTDSSCEDFFLEERRMTRELDDDNDAHYADQGPTGNNGNPMTVEERNLQQQPDMKAVGGGDSMDSVCKQESAIPGNNLSFEKLFQEVPLPAQNETTSMFKAENDTVSRKRLNQQPDAKRRRLRFAVKNRSPEEEQQSGLPSEEEDMWYLRRCEAECEAVREYRKRLKEMPVSIYHYVWHKDSLFPSNPPATSPPS